MPGKHRSGCTQSAIGWNTGPPVEELEKVPNELKGSATLLEEQQYELTSTPLPRAVSLVAYVAEDGLVSHQWEERPLVLERSYAPVERNARARKWECVSWGAGRGRGYRGLSE